MLLATKQVRRGKVLSARKNLQEQLKRRRSFERRLTPQIQKGFSFTAREAVDLLESSRPIELTKSRAELSKILSSHYQAVIKSFGDNFHYIKRKQEDKFDLYYRQYMVEFGGQKITNMTRTQQQRIIAVIDRSDFTGVADIGKQIREANKPTMTKARSVLIARTETHSASNYSNHQVAKEVGIPMKKRWVATNDDRTRSHHSSISGTEVGMDEDFEIVVNGIPYKMAYAGDPRGGAVNTINCRCVVMYVEPEDVVVDTTERVVTPTEKSPNVIDIAFLLSRASKQTRKRYNEEFDEQLTEQQKFIVDKLDKPKEIKQTKRGYYRSVSQVMSAKLGKRDGRGGETVKSGVISHEYGHHIDYEFGTSKFEAWSERNKAFTKAIEDDIAKLQLFNNKKRKEFLDEMFETLAIKREIPKKGMGGFEWTDEFTTLRNDYYGNVSDIVDALVGGQFRNEYKMWGHEISYWVQNDGSVQKEIFANLFSIKNNQKAYDIAKKIIPNTVREFEKKLDDVESKLRKTGKLREDLPPHLQALFDEKPFKPFNT